MRAIEPPPSDAGRLPGSVNSGPTQDPGLRLRPYRGPSDHPAMARLICAARAGNGSPAEISAEQLANDYAHLTNCDLEHDCRIVELDGRPVAYGRTYWADRTDGRRSFEAITNVDPAARGRGVEATILAWQLGRLAGLVDALAAGPPAILAVYAYGADAASRADLEAAGFSVARRHAELVRPDLAGIPDPSLPDGFEIRPIDPADRAMHRRVFDADVAAFADHWGDVDASDEAFEAFLGDPLFDPHLWRVAFCGDEIAGQVLSFMEPVHSDGTRIGWTESISVQRPHRRRGIARALLADSLRAVRDAGATCAALGVDTGNPNQALRLYESLGFRIVSDLLEYHRPVPARGEARSAVRP